MIFGTILGKKYPLTKYVNVIIITTGVALFMGGGSSTRKPGGGSDTTLIGALMLSISLCFDGATGAYEDKLMGNDHVEPFDLMYNIQLGKSVISFCTLVATNGLGAFFNTLSHGGIMLVLLGLTGALGQIFLFITISKFGALNCALIGLARKMLSLLLSFILYGHTLNAFQTVGLTLSLAAMIANFYEKGGGKKEGKKATESDRKEAVEDEKVPLMIEEEGEGEGERVGEVGGRSLDGKEVESTVSSSKLSTKPVASSPAVSHSSPAPTQELIDLEMSPVGTDVGDDRKTSDKKKGVAIKYVV